LIQHCGNESIAKKNHIVSTSFFKKTKNILQVSEPTLAPKETPPNPIRPLFRQQAIAHLSTQQYGTVILARSVSHRFLTVLFVLIALSIVAFFVLFSTTRKAQSSGVLLPNAGVLRVLPTQSGIVMQKQVQEGQSVKAGDILFVLSSERSSASAGDAQKTISGLLQSRRDSYGTELKQSGVQAQQRLAALQSRVFGMQADSHKLDAQIALQQQRVAIAEQTLKRYSDLQATNYISAVQLQDRQAELLDQRQRLADLHRVKSGGQRELATAQADMRDLQVQAQRDIAALQRNVSALQQDLTDSEARREFVVRAAQAGVVTAITAELGQTVAANQPLASLLPAGAELEAEIYAPSRSIGFVKPGMQVLLRYQAYPYQKFGQYAATVREVASTSLLPDELAVPGAAGGANGEPVYRIRLRLDKQSVQAYGKALPLKSGMLVDASILLEQRRLYEWVLEPLFSISGRM
jgi:membrane fusion protein